LHCSEWGSLGLQCSEWGSVTESNVFLEWGNFLIVMFRVRVNGCVKF
jgi:hypothetical protein